MSEFDRDALEDLLRQASPRPTPTAERMAASRVAVFEEWRSMAGRRRARRQWTGLAVAATLLIAAFVAIHTLRLAAVEPVRVATIEKSFGPVYLLGEGAELRETEDLSTILSGQTLVTGHEAGLAIAWQGGGSLRVDEASRIRFVDETAVLLESGRVYFDSRPGLDSVDAEDAPRFLLRTEYGEVRHVGTQFMTQVDADALIVSVREGQVHVEGLRHAYTARRGQQVVFDGSQRPVPLDLAGDGAAWDWVGRTTPAADVDGRTLYEFLSWVSRELGLQLEFTGQAEAIAHATILRGTIDAAPRESLRLRLATADLGWRISEGVIHIFD